MHRPVLNILLAMIAFVLSACTSLPERPSAGRDGTGRVGYFVQMNDSPMHSHASGGITGGYNRPYPQINWQLTQFVSDTLVRKLTEGTRFVPVDLKASGYRLDDLTGLIAIRDGIFTVSQNKQALVDKLRSNHGIDHVVLIQPASTGATSFCTPTGYCTSVNGINSGLFTKTEMFGYVYKAVLGAQFEVYSLNPVAALSAYSPTTVPNMMFLINSFSKPKSWQQITEQEWLPVKNEVMNAAEDLARRAVNSLLGVDAVCPTSFHGSQSDTSRELQYGPKLGCVKRLP